MIVDDRLETVLRTHTAGRAGLNTQLRQLVDILGRTPDHAWTDQHADALTRLDALHGELGDSAAAVLIGLCTLRSPRLIAHLVTRGPRTALATIGAARIGDADWLRLVPVMPINARGVLRHRRDLGPPVIAMLERLGIDDFVLSAPEYEAAPSAVPVPPVESEPERAPGGVLVSMPAQRSAEPAVRERAEGAGAIVRRIEAFRRSREAADRADLGQTRLPFAEDPETEPAAIAVDIVIDAAGTIVTADGVDPALLVGHAPFALAGPAVAASVDAVTLDAFRARRPIVAGRLVLDGAARIAGAWRIDAAPQFGSDAGQFTGYRARLRRPPAKVDIPASESAQAATGPGFAGADMLQQLLHELRTPINAIQGFAELIQQQLLGPTPHQYRSLAASIAADAARMLAGFEDVERLVRLETGRARIEPGEADLVAIVTRLVTQLEPLIAPREVRLRWTVPAEPMPIPIDPAEAERMLWRLLSTLAGAAAPGERMMLSLTYGEDGRSARLTMTLPQALALRDDDALFAPDMARGGNGGVGMLGHGFALRLALEEVRTAGGRLVRPGTPGGSVLDMTLPLVLPIAVDRDIANS